MADRYRRHEADDLEESYRRGMVDDYGTPDNPYEGKTWPRWFLILALVFFWGPIIGWWLA